MAVWPAGREAIVQTSGLPEQYAGADVSGAGRASVMLTCVASAGPLFLTMKLYTSCWPTDRGSGPAVLRIDRSAHSDGGGGSASFVMNPSSSPFFVKTGPTFLGKSEDCVQPVT